MDFLGSAVLDLDILRLRMDFQILNHMVMDSDSWIKDKDFFLNPVEILCGDQAWGESPQPSPHLARPFSRFFKVCSRL